MGQPEQSVEIQPNLLDRAIGYFSPMRAAKRMQWRSFEASYRGGISTRLSTPWGTSTSYRFGTQADRQLQMNMRDRARKVYRINPIGASLVNTISCDEMYVMGKVLERMRMRLIGRNGVNLRTFGPKPK